MDPISQYGQRGPKAGCFYHSHLSERGLPLLTLNTGHHREILPQYRVRVVTPSSWSSLTFLHTEHDFLFFLVVFLLFIILCSQKHAGTEMLLITVHTEQLVAMDTRSCEWMVLSCRLFQSLHRTGFCLHGHSNSKVTFKTISRLLVTWELTFCWATRSLLSFCQLNYLRCLSQMLLLSCGNNRVLHLKTKQHTVQASFPRLLMMLKMRLHRTTCRLVVNCWPQHTCRCQHKI